MYFTLINDYISLADYNLSKFCEKHSFPSLKYGIVLLKNLSQGMSSY